MPQIPPSGDVTKLMENSQILSEMSTKNRHKVNYLMKWMRNELGATASSVGEEYDINFVIKILELYKMNTHRSQRFFRKYYKMRSKDEMFHERIAESEEILTNCQSVYMFTIPRLTPDNYRINYIKLVPGVSLENFDPKALFKRFFMMSDIRFKEETDCKGDVFLVDFTGLTYSHAVKLFNGGLLSKFIKNLKETYPRRLQALHFINVKCWHKKALTIALKMSKAGKNINKKIGTHTEDGKPIEGLDTSTERATQIFKDLNDLWTKKLISHSSWFESQENTLRAFNPRKVKKDKYEKYEKAEKQNATNHQEIFTFLELEGAFRQIELDSNEQL